MRNLLEQWGSKYGSAEVQPLVDGVWRCSLDGETYILKRRTNRTRAWEEYDLLQWLKEHNQPVSLFLCTTEGVPWAEYQGSFYVFYPYLDGTPGNALDVMEPSLAGEVGAKLAKLHQALETYGSRLEFPGFGLFHEVSSYAWPTVQSYSSQKFHYRLHDLGQDISTQLVNPYEALPRQLIHRDLHPGNLLFNDGRLVGILDFDRVRIGIRLFDICYLSTGVLSSCFSESNKRERWLGFVQDLLKGYNAVQPLEKTEGHVFLYVIYLIQLLFIAYHLDEGNTNLADVNLAVLFWIYDQHDYLQPLIEKAVTSSGRDVVTRE
ncbi:MAG TPA: phosphotransferase [Firmicutes bacterium]|nr:phosphotransferase [Bacillota bacterium]